MYKLIITFLLLFVVGIVYDKYSLKQNKQTFNTEQDLIRKYLIGEDRYNSLQIHLNNGKPNLWIYIDYEKNSRSWISFGSRTSYKLNKPYILLCIESIIRYNAENFNICIIDNYSFPILLPDWNIDLNSVSEPIQTYMTDLALMKILYTYGGILVPRSFICFKPLYTLYENSLQNEYETFVCYSQDYSNTSTYNSYAPNYLYMGSLKESNVMKNIIEKMEKLNSMDYTDERTFKGTMNQYINYLVETSQINGVEPQIIGCAKYDRYSKKKPIEVEDYVSSIPITLDKNTYGIYIQETMVSKMNTFNWLDYVSINEILNGNYNMSSYIKYSLHK